MDETAKVMENKKYQPKLLPRSRSRWDWPFTVTACPSPNAYTLALPRKIRCSPTVNVDWLIPFHVRADDLDPLAPGQVSDPGQEGEHEVELLLNRKEIRWVLHYLVLWLCHISADDEWLWAEELAHCSERVAEYDAAAPRPAPLARPRDRRRVGCSSRGGGQ